MIIRFVKMTFEPDKVQDFLKVFNESKGNIRSCEGCLSLELLRDINKPHILFTKSIWLSEDYLNQYRNSKLFEITWAKTKILFFDKPEAWSLNLEA